MQGGKRTRLNQMISEQTSATPQTKAPGRVTQDETQPDEAAREDQPAAEVEAQQEQTQEAQAPARGGLYAQPSPLARFAAPPPPPDDDE